MEINSIAPWVESLPLAETQAPAGTGRSSFAAVMQELQEVDAQFKAAEMQSLNLAVGDLENVHQVMASINKAKLSFELVAQMRNKLLEGYQEIMRMQI